MKIGREEIYKLKQLDRIEYRQKLIYYTVYFQTAWVINIIFFSLALICLTLSDLLGGVLFFGLGIYFSYIIDRNEKKYYDELNEEHFKVEVKK